MKKINEELEKIAEELRKATEKMAVDVREGAKQSQEGAETVLRAAHRMHNLLFTIPDRLMGLAKKLKGSNGRG